MKRGQERLVYTILGHLAQTDFGEAFGIDQWLGKPDWLYSFQDNVPVFEYDTFYKDWISKALRSERSVIWDEAMVFIALTSGTSSLKEKYIPYTNTFIKRILKETRGLTFELIKQGISPFHFFNKVLTVGGSTDFKRPTELIHTLGFQSYLQAGYMSGIVYNHRPKWYNRLNALPEHVYELSTWEEKTDFIVQHAHSFNIGTITGFPSFILPILKKIIAHYKLGTIHEIWPNFRLYCHNGMSIIPYMNELKHCFGRHVDFFETYYATEGFFGYSHTLNSEYLKLKTDGSIYYEFIPFDSTHFDENGHLISTKGIINIAKLHTHRPYALVITNTSGLVRFVQGDVLVFSDIAQLLFKIEGRISEIINTAGELLPASQLKTAVSSYLSDNKMDRISDYFLTTELKNGKNVYTFYFVNYEVGAERFGGLDGFLQNYFLFYKSYRHDGSLAKPEIAVLSHHTYEKILQITNKLNGQGKMPFYVKGELKKVVDCILHQY